MTQSSSEMTPQADLGEETAEVVVASRLTRTQLVLRRFWRPVGTKIGAIGLGLVLLLAAIGPLLTPWSFDQVDVRAFLRPPSADHLLGTTQGGRDVFAMVIQGLRRSLVIGFAVAAIQTTLAALIGATAAYFGKVVDRSILWIIDLLLVIPSFLIVAVLNTSMRGAGGSLLVLILLLAAFGWMISGRVVRAMTLSVVSLDYVNAAKYMSVPSWVTITKHVIPNISSYLIIDFTLGVVRGIMAETTLSFFGFGVQPPDTSLGTLLAEGARMATTAPWVFLAPAFLLVWTLLCVNFLGDSLRDALDPSSKSGGRA